MTKDQDSREAASRKYRPSKIKRLLIAEAPPKALDRYFYFEDVMDKDFLFVELMKVLCVNDHLDVGEVRARKAQFLKWFRDEGFFLIDAVEDPLPEDASKQERGRIVWNSRDDLIKRMKSLVTSDTDVILVKSSVFGLCTPLKNAGFKVINEDAIEFPCCGNQKKFREKMTKLLGPYLKGRKDASPCNGHGSENAVPAAKAASDSLPSVTNPQLMSSLEKDKNRKPRELRIVIDGSNIAHDGQDGRPNVDNIIEAHRQLLDRFGVSEAYVVIGPGQLFRIRENSSDYKKLKSHFSGALQKYLIESPGGHLDDEFVIQIAFDMDLLILTNDRFQDHILDRPEMKQRLNSKLVKYKMVNGNLVAPKLEYFK